MNSTVFFWNQASQGYDTPITKSTFFGWGAADSRVITIGEAFFMEAFAPISVDEVEPYNLNI